MEAFGRVFQTKFEFAGKFLQRLPAHGVPADTAQQFASELAAQEIRYALSTGHLYLSAAYETSRQAALSEFNRIMLFENFDKDIDAIVARAELELRAALKPLAPLRNASTSSTSGAAADPAKRPARAAQTTKAAAQHPSGPGQGGAKVSKQSSQYIAPGADPIPTGGFPADVQRLLEQYPRGSGGAVVAKPVPAASRLERERCAECDQPMLVDADRNELRCPQCDAVRHLDGVVLEDVQLSNTQESQKTKSGTFNPNRHFQYWWQHILAREPEEEIGDVADPDNQYGEKLIEAMRGIVRRDQKILRLLTVADVRAMLRELGRTNLNKDVALLLKKLTGIGPPSPSDSLSLRVEKLFSKAIEVGERLRAADRTNRNYYPFYISAILDAILDAKDENRRILYYVYMQSDDTVRKNDAEWKLICAEMAPSDGIAYRPSDRQKYQSYKPC